MKIIKEHTQYHEYALESDYDTTLVEYCQNLKKIFGWQEFQWDHENKKWRFKDPSVIIMLRDKFEETEITEEVKTDLKNHIELKDKEQIQTENAKKIREATVSNLKIKGIKGELYEYQKLGIEFLLNSGGRALLADSPGVGKSVQALGFITHNNYKRNLIICPASIKFVWVSEITKWTKMKSFVINPKTNLQDIPFDVQCVIVNFDILKKFHNEFKKYKWNSCIIDECQLIKNPSAARSKAVKSIAQEISNIIMLTGTPLLSAPIEMFNMLNIIDPKVWNNYYSYATKFCGGRQGYWGFEAKGATNLNELRIKISKYFLRRTKDEVLKELPTKNYIEVPIDLPKEERKQYDLVESNLVEYLKSYKKEKTNKEITKSLNAEKLVKLNLLREINTMGKIPTARELIDNIIDAKEKVLVFSSFNAPLKELAEKYEENSVIMLGETQVEERGEIVKQFQEDPNIKIFFGGTKSAGVGITLTAASNVIFLDLPWNPADIEQSENRAHRPGATYQSLNIYQIISYDSIDEFMKKLLNKKQVIINKLIEGKKVEKDDKMMDNYLKLLTLKHKK